MMKRNEKAGSVRAHPTAENIYAYLKGEMGREAESRVRLHVLDCIPCLGALEIARGWLKGRGELPGCVVIQFPALRRLRGFVPGPELALAAAGPEGNSSEVVKAEGEPAIVGRASIEGDGTLLVSVEEGEKPMAGISLSLELVGPEGEGEVVASGTTDEHGEVVLGPARGFSRPPIGRHYRIRAVL